MISPEMTHLIAGGIGGTIAALVTCPLEVVKVRLQSRNCQVAKISSDVNANSTNVSHSFLSRLFGNRGNLQTFGVMQSIRLIVATEGTIGLFKGVGPTLVGVIPSRSVYFSSYYYAQSCFNEVLSPDSSAVYFCSAAVSSAISSTITNPIWYVKTRLQLDFGAGDQKLTVTRIIKSTFKEKGIRGFYRGVTASYAGISETGINFMIYENLKVKFLNRFHENNQDESSSHMSKLQSYSDPLICMAASMLSKTFATTIAYPHEVARTRLREANSRYTGFFQTIALVCKEEGVLGLYRGLFTHYLRQVPNTCIVMGVYEGILLIFDKWGLAEHCGHNGEDD